MIKRPIESQDQILQSTLPALRVIPTLLSSTLHAMQNSQTLQRFLSLLYIEKDIQTLMTYESTMRTYTPQNSLKNTLQTLPQLDDPMHKKTHPR